MNPKTITQDNSTSTGIIPDDGTMVDESVPQLSHSTTGSQSEAVLSIKKPFRIIIRGMKINDKNNPS